MSQVFYRDIAGKVNLMPLNNAMFLTTDGGYYNEYNFAQLETSSSFKIIPIERQTSKGGNKIVGWNYEAVIVLLQDDIVTIIDVLEEIKDYCDIIELDFGNMTPSNHNWTEFPIHINSNEGLAVMIQPEQKPGIIYQIETIELGLKITISFKGTIKNIISQYANILELN